MTINVNIENISDELYYLLLEEFKKQAKEKGIDFESFDDQQWEIKCVLS